MTSTDTATTMRQRITIPREPHPIVLIVDATPDGSVSIRCQGHTLIMDQEPTVLDGRAGTIPSAGRMRVMAYVDSGRLMVSLKLDGLGTWLLAEHLGTSGVRVEHLAGES